MNVRDFAMKILTSYPQDKLKEELQRCGVSEDNINKIIETIYKKGGNDG